MAKREQKIIVASAMHGRQATVNYCLDRLQGLEVYMAYTDSLDGFFLHNFDRVKSVYASNSPLSHKWNTVIKSLKNVDFDAVILLGSDDFIDANFLKFIKQNISNYDMIAFTDMYFEKGKDKYYWGGYTNHRKGEPAGAGKTYTKDFLGRINYDLFSGAVDRGLDGVSWNVCNNAKAKVLLTSMKENNILCCDVKDGQGITKLEHIQNIIQL